MYFIFYLANTPRARETKWFGIRREKVTMLEIFFRQASSQYAVVMDGDAQVSGKVEFSPESVEGSTPFPSAAKIVYEFEDGWQF